MSRAPVHATIVALVAALALSVAACGKRGDLEPVDRERQTHPRTYPSR